MSNDALTVSDRDQPLIVEAGGIEYIQENLRHGHPRNQFSIRCSPVLYLAPIFLGGMAVQKGLGLIDSIIAIVLANFLGCLGAGVCAAMGPRYGMPQLTMSRSSFGYYGNYIPAICASILFVGYSTIGTIVGAKALENMLGLPFAPLAIAVGIASLLVALYGYNLLHVTGRWVTMAGVILLVLATVAALAHGIGPGAANTLDGSDYWRAWLSLFTVVFSFTVSWMLYASDYSRYLPSNTKFSRVFGYAFSGLFLGSCWMMILGAILVSINPQGALEGFGDVLYKPVLWVVLITLTITSITHNAVNLYSCSMSSLAWDFPVKRTTTVILVGIACCFLAVYLGGGSKFLHNFDQFLILMSYFMLPWLALRLVEYLHETKLGERIEPSHFYSKVGPHGGVKWRGLGAFFLGILVSVPFMASDLYQGPVAQYAGGADLSYFVSFFVTALSYSLITAQQKRLIPQTMEE